jgi:acyl-CoA thioester hydrolase
MLETGRVEILYDPDAPLAAPGCEFVIVNLNLDFRSEISWPGCVNVGTRVTKIGRSSVTFEQALFQGGRLTATAQTVVVQVNKMTGRSEPLSHTAIDRLRELTSPRE